MNIKVLSEPIKVVFICQFQNAYIQALEQAHGIELIGIISPDKSFNSNTLWIETTNDEEIYNELQRRSADTIITFGWHKLFPKKITSSFQIINIHPSYLPEYRGAKPIEAILSRGEKFGGITFHIIDEFEDRGIILYQELIDLKNIRTSIDYQNVIQAEKYTKILTERLLLKNYNTKIRSRRKLELKKSEIIDQTKADLYQSLTRKKIIVDSGIQFNFKWIKLNKIIPIKICSSKTLLIYLKS